MRTLDTDVAIVGSGVAGSVLAAILRRRGFEVVVFEQQKRVAERYRGEILQPYAVEILRRHGFLDGLLDAGAVRAHEFLNLFVRRAKARVSRDPIRPSKTIGGEAVILRHRLLMEAIRGPVRPLLGERFFEGTRVAAVERMADGRHEVQGVDPEGDAFAVRAKLLVAADGAQSMVRRALAFEADAPAPAYCFAGIVLSAPTSLFSAFTSIFLLDERLAGNAFPVGKDEVRLCLAVTLETSRAAHDELLQILMDFGASTLRPLGLDLPAEPDLVEALRIEPVFHVRVPTATTDGVCLVGDASGTVHPVTGLGMTLACNDVLHLARVLGEDRPTDVVPASILKGFETSRARIRDRAHELSDIFVRIYLEANEDDEVVESYWRWLNGQDPGECHPDVARQEVLSRELDQELELDPE